jgi:hypothetical protein
MVWSIAIIIKSMTTVFNVSWLKNITSNQPLKFAEAVEEPL